MGSEGAREMKPVSEWTTKKHGKEAEIIHLRWKVGAEMYLQQNVCVVEPSDVTRTTGEAVLKKHTWAMFAWVKPTHLLF